MSTATEQPTTSGKFHHVVWLKISLYLKHKVCADGTLYNSKNNPVISCQLACLVFPLCPAWLSISISESSQYFVPTRWYH
jgi:hypothetical protein